VFKVNRDDGERWLDTNWDDPDNRWNGDNRFVFLRRKSFHFSPAFAGEFCFLKCDLISPAGRLYYVIMKISYILHAKVRMKERGISRKQVEEAIVSGQYRYIQKNGRIKCIYKDKGKKLIVVYRQVKENYKVITLFYSYEN